MIFEWDDFRLNRLSYRLERAGHPVPLEPKAFDVLALLVSDPGRLFTKQDIFEAVWPDTAVTDHALTRVIAQLRRALGDDSRASRYIETVPTRGYRWAGPIRASVALDSATGLGEPRSVGTPTTLPIAVATDGVTDVPPVRPGSRAQTTSRLRAPRVAAAIVLLGMVAAGLTWWLAYRSSGAVPAAAAWAGDGTTIAWPVQVTTHAGLDLTPAMSPRGDALAFASDRSGALEIYVRPVTEGAADLPLTSDGGQNVQPAWSPDGRLLAYHSIARGGVWVMPARGGTARQVIAEGSNPAWSPDGRSLVYQSDEHVDITPSAFGAMSGSTLWLVPHEGGAPRQLTTAGTPLGGHASPAFSPDGRFVAFTTFDGGRDTGAWLVAIGSGQVTRLTESPRLFELVFAPDGRAIYAAGGEALAYRIPFDAVRGRAAGPVESLPVAGVPGVRGLSIAADGSRLVFTGMSLSSQIWAQPVSRDGSARGDAYPLTEDNSRRNWMAAVSPDGSRIAYMSARRGDGPNVWLMNADGSGKVQLTTGRYSDGKPTWYPDGRRVAFVSYRGPDSGVWSIDVSTRRESRVFDREVERRALTTEGQVKEMELAPSMTQGAFSVLARPAGLRQVFVGRFDGPAPRALGDATTWVGYPAWSPDERRLAVEVKEGSSTHAGVIEVATGAMRRITHERGQTWVRSWSPDGARIAAATLRDGRWNLRAIDVATGTQLDMLPPAPVHVYVRYPDWSPRGDLVVYERGELRGNIWEMAIR